MLSAGQCRLLACMQCAQICTAWVGISGGDEVAVWDLLIATQWTPIARFLLPFVCVVSQSTCPPAVVDLVGNSRRHSRQDTDGLVAGC